MKKILFLVLVMTFLLGCTHTPSQLLIKPETGQYVRCAHGAWGWGLAGALAIASAQMSQDQCIRDFKQLGFIEIETVAVTGFFFDGSDPLKEMIVTRVEPGSPADRAGVKVGDKVIEKNGVGLKCVGEYLSIPRSQVGDIVVLKILREDQELIFTMKTVSMSLLPH